MSAVCLPSAANHERPFFHWAGLAVATLLISFLFFRVPESPGGEGNPSYRMLLDLSFRPGFSAGTSFNTLDGPLAPLQNPIYVGRSIWRSIVWQTVGNFVMTALVVGAAFRLPKVRRWWALSLFVVFGISDSAIPPWITILVLGAWIARSDRRAVRFLCGAVLGILALTSIAHLVAGTAAIAFSLRRPDSSSLQKKFGGHQVVGFSAGLIGMWLLLEQTLTRLGSWLWFGLTKTWTPSLLVVPSATIASFTWAGLAATAWVAIVVRCWKTNPQPSERGRQLLLLTLSTFFAWKLAALQPSGTPVLFFVTILFGGFLLLPRAPVYAAIALGLGFVGACLPDRSVATDAAGRINRRLLLNISEFRELAGVRARLDENFTGLGGSFAMPSTRGVLAGDPVGILGDYAMPPILGGFRVLPPPNFAMDSWRDGQSARENAQILESGAGPQFWLHRIDAPSELLPALRDGPGQLALYRGYNFVLSELGFSLWKRKDSPPSEKPKLIKEGIVRAGEVIALPRTDRTSSWLELDCVPNWAGWVRDQLQPLPEPSLRITAGGGTELTYGMPWRLARAGFLARPFFRSDSELLEFEESGSIPELATVTVNLPAEARWAWRSTVRYRIYEMPPVVSAQIPGLTTPLKNQYAALNRLPAAISAPFAPLSGIVADKPAVFMHPDSVLELIVRPSERFIGGSFGIAPGAYANSGPNVTDGVSFSIEYVPASGVRSILFKRDLDPSSNPEDRGPQEFAVSLPPSRGGRLLFRTYNLPDKGSSFDWSYWREIELK